MTEEQWYHLNAQIASIRALAVALAETAADQTTLRKRFIQQGQLAVASVLDSPAPEVYLDKLQAELDRLDDVLWAPGPPTQP